MTALERQRHVPGNAPAAIVLSEVIRLKNRLEKRVRAKSSSVHAAALRLFSPAAKFRRRAPLDDRRFRLARLPTHDGGTWTGKLHLRPDDETMRIVNAVIPGRRARSHQYGADTRKQ